MGGEGERGEGMGGAERLTSSPCTTPESMRTAAPAVEARAAASRYVSPNGVGIRRYLSCPDPGRKPASGFSA